MGSRSSIFTAKQLWALIYLPPSSLTALESGTSSGFFAALSSPIGMTRRNTSYDDLMEAPMHSPPSDMSVNILWKDPVIPKHKFRDAAEVTPCPDTLDFPAYSWDWFGLWSQGSGLKLLNVEEAAPARAAVPVVKAKATSLMSSIMISKSTEHLILSVYMSASVSCCMNVILATE